MALLRIALLILLTAFAHDTFGQTISAKSVPATSKQYAGKTAEEWVSEVIVLALTIRRAEEDYEQNLRDCAKLKGTKEDKAPPCVRANHSYNTSQSARNEYQRLLNSVSGTSLPVEWFEAHFTWVRYGPEWRN